MTILVTGATGTCRPPSRPATRQARRRCARPRPRSLEGQLPGRRRGRAGRPARCRRAAQRVRRRLHAVPAQRGGAGRIHPGADRAQPGARGRHRADRLPVGDPQRPLRERAALRGQVRRRADDRADGLQRHHPAPGLLHGQRSHDQGRRAPATASIRCRSAARASP